MRHFTIDAENNITIHPSKKAARDSGAPVFATEEQFADLIGPDNKRLVAIFNSLPGVKAVTKFANRKIATTRIWEAIQQLGAPVLSEPAPEQPAETTSAGSIPAVETQFDPIETKPAPVNSGPQTASEPAVAPRTDRPTPAPAASAEPLATAGAPVPDLAPKAAKASKKATRAPKPAKAPKEAKPAKAEGVREGSKTATVVALLKRNGGATLADLMTATNWQAHSIRGYVSGTLNKKMGLKVNSAKGEDGQRRYSINA